jgi:hypothetical protein
LKRGTDKSGTEFADEKYEYVLYMQIHSCGCNTSGMYVVTKISAVLKIHFIFSLKLQKISSECTLLCGYEGNITGSE